MPGGIAHDFNNILTAIMGYTQLALYDVPKGTELYDDLEQILGGGHRAQDLVKQILAFSRQYEQKRRPILISPILKEAIKFLRASLPSTIDMRQQIEVSNLVVEADPTEVHQVMMNLCTNAAHAMREEGGTLDTSLTKIDLDDAAAASTPDLHPGPYVLLTVSDTGHGMTSDVIERMFEPYFTTKEEGEGTGLGLAAVHGIAKSLGGAVTVRTEPGRGSTFCVYFPRIEGATTAMPEKAGPLPSGHERILFVDDEQALVMLGKHMLEHLGYEVVIRTSSEEALELFRTNPDRFDLVITDLTMPKITGDKLATELVRIRPDIPVILCTGYSAITEEKIKQVGLCDLVMKPIGMPDLAKSVRNALDKK
ncbi:MAG: ATP-binding protein [Pseudomonadota bacterium]